jgi:hypothetical protein
MLALECPQPLKVVGRSANLVEGYAAKWAEPLKGAGASADARTCAGGREHPAAHLRCLTRWADLTYCHRVMCSLLTDFHSLTTDYDDHPAFRSSAERWPRHESVSR